MVLPASGNLEESLNVFKESVVSLHFWYIGLCSREMATVLACLMWFMGW